MAKKVVEPKAEAKAIPVVDPKTGIVMAYSMKKKAKTQLFKGVVTRIEKGARVTFIIGGFSKEGDKLSAIVGEKSALIALEKGTVTKGEGWPAEKKKK